MNGAEADDTTLKFAREPQPLAPCLPEQLGTHTNLARPIFRACHDVGRRTPCVILHPSPAGRAGLFIDWVDNIASGNVDAGLVMAASLDARSALCHQVG